MALVRHRETARVLLQANSGAFLLLFTHWDPRSGLKPRWVTPGGGIEANEDPALAAIRELAEETGLVLPLDSLNKPIAELSFEQYWTAGDHETGLAHIFYHRISNEFAVDRSSWTAEEHRDILAERWWTVSALVASGEPVGPPGLLDLMVELAG
jgi:8-oxo-dGTP pyrophosphatase MutT (NUDIX family)